MIEFDQFKYELSTKAEPLEHLGASLDLENKRKRILELDRMMEEPDFWTDPERANRLSTENHHLKNELESYQSLKQSYDDIGALIEMGVEEGDESVIPEIRELLSEFSEKLDSMSTRLLLSGEYDAMNAILRLNAGAGGTEANDWAGMLYRMYTRWAERRGFGIKILDYLEGEEAGIKSVTMEIDGDYAYGYLRSESGIHRLVRISPFNAQGKRQTSFVSCDVMPDIETDIDVDIREEDIKMEVFRSSGAGGQHINKTSSAVRLIHIPSGMVAECQEERSQLQNREKAMRLLRARLYEIESRKRHEESAAEKRSQLGTGERSEKIRTYNFPQGRVTDHRIKLSLYCLEEILGGDLDPLIDPLITAEQAEKLSRMEERI